MMPATKFSRSTQLILTSGLTALVVWCFYDLRNIYTDVMAVSSRLPYSLPIVSGYILIIAALSIMFFWQPKKVFAWIAALRLKSWMQWGLIILIFMGFSFFLLMSKWGAIFTGAAVRSFFLYSLLIISFLILGDTTSPVPGFNNLIAIILLFGGIFTVIWTLQAVTDYPFRLSWSEGNRFWDYSVLFGRRLYNYPQDQTIPAYIDIGRQSLWGLPFLFGSPTIFQIRLWNAFLYTIPYFVFGLLIFRRSRGQPFTWVFAGIWTFLFLSLGPIYTPLVLAAILVSGSKRFPFILRILAVGLAGYYAELTRYTWMFAPAIWAWVDSFSSIPGKAISLKSKAVFQSLAIAAAGFIGGFIIPAVREQIKSAASGEASVSILSEGRLAYLFGRQPLLWDRLLPNPTFNLGLIPAIVLAVGPVLIFLVFFFKSGKWPLSKLQRASTLLALAAFFIVGLVVSVKIGGGSNLHNFDMFLITILIVIGLAWQDGADDLARNPSSNWIRVTILLAVAYPALHGIYTAQPLRLPEAAKVEQTMETVNKFVTRGDQLGEVLFIDHRQLLTFGYVGRVKLIADYEKKWLMDEAISGNEAFFQPFFKDLSQQRFSLIVSEPLYDITRGDESQFGLENDAWVKWVSIPVLEHYRPIFTDVENGIQILKPIGRPLTDYYY